MKLKRSNIKHHVTLLSKTLREEVDQDCVLTYIYDYVIRIEATQETHSFCIEEYDLEADFKDNDWDFILHYTKKRIN